MSFLNQIAGQTAPAESFIQLPPGDYQGFITEIIQQEPDENCSTRRWKCKIKTDKGFGEYTIWDFDSSDIIKMQSDEQFRENAIKKIAFTKRIFVDLGLASPQFWDGHNDSVIESIPKLIGKRCTLVVAKQLKDPTKTTSFLNAPRDGVKTSVSPVQSLPKIQSTQPNQMTSPSLDDIPF